jgi:hypothetical protein
LRGNDVLTRDVTCNIDSRFRLRARRSFSVIAIGVLFAVLAACGSPQPQTIILRVYDDTPAPAQTTAPAPQMSPVAVAPASFTATPGGQPVAPSLKAAPQCLITRLSPGEHISAGGSITMTEDEAAGPMMCQIQRDSCAFGLLIADRDPEIGFSEHKPAPLTDEDRQMHPALLMPLTRLRNLVQTEWNGTVRLYVTASYDSTGEHDLAQTDMARKYSLHFEGRSIDLIPDPASPQTMDRLCALAHCAGFDWVHNESDHCHASVNAPSLCTYCSGVGPPTAAPSDTPSPTATP